MAERRMFAKTIIDSDAFLEMPQSTQLLYFHLSMRADDEGFVNKPKSIMRLIGCRDDDVLVLISKKFIIPFDSGVVVIKHWKLHNYIRGDRLNPTKYLDEKALLQLDDNQAYTICQSSDSQLSGKCHTEDRLGKDRLGKDRLDNSVDKPQAHKFIPPTPSEVQCYCAERKNNVDYDKWYDFYQSKGWMVGKNKMKDWKACVRTWEKDTKQKQQNQKPGDSSKRQYDVAELEKKLLGRGAQ